MSMDEAGRGGVEHTPGTWKALVGDAGTDRWIVCVDGPKMYHVATIENGAPGDTLETEAANARLFAAAPDLLAVCKAYREECRRQGIRFGSINGDADFVIAKAEGRALPTPDPAD